MGGLVHADIVSQDFGERLPTYCLNLIIDHVLVVFVHVGMAVMVTITG